MKLMHPMFSRPICFKENNIQVLTIEHPRLFREMVLEQIGQMERGDGAFLLSKNDLLLDCAECLHVVTDYAHIGIPDKKLQNKLIASLLKSAGEEMEEDTQFLCQSIQRYLGKLAAMADYPVAYERSENLAALLKAMDFHVDFEGLPVHEALYEHLALYHRLQKNLCLVLVHAKAFFSEEELRQLYDLARYQKWNLFLLESAAGKRIEGEMHRLFDRDLCELFLDQTEEMR